MAHVVVVGGGPAGVTAALRARELGAAVTLIERNNMGGTCTNDGCVPTRVLAKAARLRRDAEQFADYGLVGEIPAVDFERVMARAQQVVYTVHEKKQLIRHLEELGVTVYSRVGAASFVDPHTIALQNGTRLEADTFILCAGGHARRLDFPGAEYALTHSDIWGLKALPKSVAIVGGSATGCQLTAIFNAFGTDVHLFELAPRILNLEDELISQTMHQAFERRGVHVTLGISGVDRIENGGRTLVYREQDQSRSLDVEAIVLAVGWPGMLSSSTWLPPEWKPRHAGTSPLMIICDPMCPIFSQPGISQDG